MDGLNEAFVAHPAFEAVNIVSSVISMTVPVPDVQYAFGGLAVGAVAAGRVTSYARTKAYIKTVNTDIFHSGGLHVSILSTKKMMEMIGCEESELDLPALNSYGDIEEESLAVPMEGEVKGNDIHHDDPRMRRIRALHGYVMPLTLDVPQVVAPERLFKRIANSHVQWLSRRQQDKLLKKREKDVDKFHEKQAKLEQKRLRREQEITMLERKLFREQDRLHSSTDSDKCSSRNQKKVVQNIEKRTEKIQEQIVRGHSEIEEAEGKYQEDAAKQLRKSDEREYKIARKIRWVVIHEWKAEEYDGNCCEIR